MVNPGEFVGGAVLGTSMSLLCAAIIDLIQKNNMFSPLLREIQMSLKPLADLISQMSQANSQLPYAKDDELEGLNEVITAGNKLVVKCGKISKWNFINRKRYSDKLIEWRTAYEDKSRVVRIQESRDVKMIAVGVQAIEAGTKKIEVSSVNTETSTTKIEVSTAKIEASTAKIEVSSVNTEASTAKIEASTAKIEVSSVNTEALAAKIETSVETLIEDVKTIKNSTIQDQSACFKAWSGVPELPQLLVGSDAPLEELKKMIFDDKVSMFVVTALGGCGKSTLASKLCRDKDVKDKFNNSIFFVKISRDVKMELIVKQLYQQKGMKVPDFINEDSVDMVRKFLNEEGQCPLLVVLDNVGSDSVSASLLAMFDLPLPNYKVLVTSTTKLDGFGPNYDVPFLDDNSAMKLFHYHALLGKENSNISEDLARQIVELCKGIPLAIEVAGALLRGKPKTVWEARASEWSEGSSILDHMTPLRRCLQSSIDELEKEKPIPRKCFLDLGLFPRNKFIPVATLFDMWAELYGLHDDKKCISNLYDLSTRRLANLVDTRYENMDADGYYSQHYVIQHDLLRELAIYLSKEDNKKNGIERLMIDIKEDKFPEWFSEPDYRTTEARLVSISTDRVFSMKFPNMQLPKARVLVLQFQTEEYALPIFVRKMHELKVLVVTCDDFFVSGAALGSFLLLNALKNLKTIILEGISIPSIAKYPIKWECVKKISFSRCYEFSKAFGGDSIQISRFFPKLEKMNIDFCNLVKLPDDLGLLILLRELNITNCSGISTLPERTDELVNLEVLRLRFCRDFSKFPPLSKLKKLKSLDLAYCSSIQELPKTIGDLSSLEKLDTRNCSTLTELPRSISNIKNLEVICTHKTYTLTKAIINVKNIRMEPKNLSWDDFGH